MILPIVNAEGIKFNVKVITQGSKYGLSDCCIHDSDDPLIEFYDAEYAGQAGFDVEGQFITRYYLSTLAAPTSERCVGLDLHLDGGEPKWVISSGNVYEAVQFATQLKGNLDKTL